jgi:branched-chain amino acid transport system ATP-binding protein
MGRDRLALLEIQDIRVRYGAIEAVKGISLSVEEGEIVTLIGGNGAGKTTTLKAVSGILHPVTGSIRFQGKRIDDLPAHQIVSLGLGHAPEGRKIFGRMSVTENLEMGMYAESGGRDRAARRRHAKESRERVYALFPRLRERERQAGGTLSGGEQQMLAIGRALMTRPVLLMLDEPSMGLAPILVERIFAVLRDIHAQGTTILLVEQNAHMALNLADRGYVIESGSIVLEDAAERLLGNDEVRKAYLGEG